MMTKIKDEVLKDVLRIHTCYDGHSVRCSLIGERVGESIDLTLQKVGEIINNRIKEIENHLKEEGLDKDITENLLHTNNKDELIAELFSKMAVQGTQKGRIADLIRLKNKLGLK